MRAILCRPQGGLNDMLAQIARCLHYAWRYDRRLVVDTAYAGSPYWQDDLSAYVCSIEPRMTLDVSTCDDAFWDLPTEPASLAGGPRAYEARQAPASLPVPTRYTDAEGTPLSFDFERDHAAPLLLHHAFGGGEASITLFPHLRLRERLRLKLAQRLNSLGGAYTGLHIRHTDMRGDPRPLLRAVAAGAPPPYFVATDSAAAHAMARDILGSGQVISFSRDLSDGDAPLHRRPGRLAPAEARRHNDDALLDLLTLALADRLYWDRVDHKGTWTMSGFSLLANNLRAAPEVLQAFLGGSPCD